MVSRLRVAFTDKLQAQDLIDADEIVLVEHAPKRFEIPKYTLGLDETIRVGSAFDQSSRENVEIYLIGNTPLPPTKGVRQPIRHRTTESDPGCNLS